MAEQTTQSRGDHQHQAFLDLLKDYRPLERALRHWLLAYAASAFVLLIHSRWAFEKILDAGFGFVVFGSFGIAIQIQIVKQLAEVCSIRKYLILPVPTGSPDQPPSQRRQTKTYDRIFLLGYSLLDILTYGLLLFGTTSAAMALGIFGFEGSSSATQPTTLPAVP